MTSTKPMERSTAGLSLVMDLMQKDGHSPLKCLKGTGLQLEDMGRPNILVTLRQETIFYRNVLNLSKDRTIGLRLGKVFPLRNHGLLGYAMLSAPTLRQALVIAGKFGDYLTPTWFHMNFSIHGDTARFEYSDRFDVDEDVRSLLYDRDCVAARECFAELIGKPFNCIKVMLPHGGNHKERDYRNYWGCPVSFGQRHGGLEFSSALLETALPFKDPKTSDTLSQQCQLLLAKLTRQSGMVVEIRQMLIGRPGYFPDIDTIAQRLNMPVRTLRYRLSQEGSGYQAILDEVRFALAREYLLDTKLSQLEIAGLLGYNDPGNFAHAFKRWAGVSPRQFRIANTNT